MLLLDELIQMMIGMSDEQLAKIKAFILGKLKLDNISPSIQITQRPICGSKHIIKFGMKYGKQRYQCKDCHKIFMATTNTIAHKSKHDIETWSNYVSAMLAGVSCRDAAAICGINYKTSFYWRHKIMGSLTEVLDNKLSLSGIVEADETFFPVSYKGNHSKSSFVMPRKAHHRGGCATKRGISDEQVCVSCMVSENNYQANIAGYGRITKNQLIALNKVESGTTLVTDKASAYRKYAENLGLDLVQLKAGKEYKRGMYSLAHINAFHSTLKRFLRPFNGVSTKHLGNYLNWHIWMLKTASMLFDARSADMLGQAVSNRFTITKTDIHEKDALPMVA